MMHAKIKDLKLRSKPFEAASDSWIESIEVNARIQSKCEELRASKKLEENQFLAYFCIWGVRDTYGTGWIRGCFAKSIEERGPKSSANQKILVAWMHDLRDPIGRIIEIEEDEIGARAVVELDIDKDNSVPNAKRAAYQLKKRTVNGWSFGFEYLYDKMEYDETTDTIWIKECRLYEISPVSIASIKETYTVRSVEDFEARKILLDEETDSFIKSMPKGKQLELRQLISDYITLSEIKPKDTPPLDKREPELNPKVISLGSLKINLNKL